MTVRLRLSGDPAEIEVMVKILAVVFELTGSNRLYPNRGDDGVRAYLTARIPHAGQSGQPRRGGGSQ
jgi:hypothetical protein